MVKFTPHNSSRRISKGGFTLVELLVLIGIISLLIAILLPTLLTLRVASRTASCASQQREIGRGMVLRAETRDGYMQLAGTLELPLDFTVIDSLPRAMGDSSATRYTYTPLGGPIVIGELNRLLLTPDVDLAPFLGESGSMGAPTQVSVWACPEEPPVYGFQMQGYQLGDQALIYADYRPVSYALNETVFGLSQNQLDNRRLRGKLVRVKNASRIILLGDAASEPNVSSVHTWTTSFSEGAGRTGPVPLSALLDPAQDPRVHASQMPSDRHRGGSCNLLFADGHVETMPVSPGALESPLLAAD